MSVIQNLWLCCPRTQPLLFKILPRIYVAFSPRGSTIWCHSMSQATKVSSFPDGVEQVVDNNALGVPKVEILKQKMELLGINLDNSCLPGQYHNLFCPKCKGGKLKERSLSFHIIPDCEFAMWRCFRAKCGWAGRVFANDSNLHGYGQMTEESLGLEPLGPKLIAYFKERQISEKTLSRNAVRQMSESKEIIAFTYKQNGLLVGCKFRTMEKRFWQVKGTEKMLYGIDDINHASEVIIVEGEIDKLSLEEAGFQNCVSVPGGAPGKVSKDLPPIEKDTAYQYLWNWKEYFDKVVRIILATDNDPPGRALADELAKRLGQERCWQVHWPKKDDTNCFKDANEVLKYMGADTLKRIVENAEPYTIAHY
ncbi:hypothetical protein HN51_065347 [Arachis hypogaea]|uniref:primase homolog protein n=1 Tax=Arachis ipaensis TaxID=130454 RepID=UPI0007AF7A53|nr:primase homolog protein [Arachis ipaensis]XP_025646322.1 primase homolog protein [Arachis hypogaea]QHO06522.1 uncharacterized protein DS421_14g455400 [Arachis hypogaea]